MYFGIMFKFSNYVQIFVINNSVKSVKNEITSIRKTIVF